MNKIIVLATPGFSGGRRVAYNLSKACGVHVVYLLSGHDSFHREADSNYSILVKKRNFKYLDYFYSLILLYRYIKANKIALVVSEGMISSLFVALIRCFSPIKFLMVSRIGRYWSEYRFKSIWRFIYSASDKVITPLRANLLLKPFRDKPYKYQFSLNPILVTHREISTPSASEREYILIVGRASPNKKLIESLKFSKNLSRFIEKSIICVVAGNGDYYDEVIKVADDEGIVVWGFSDNLSEVYKKSCVLVNFAAFEGFSYVSYEAALFGVPTISLDSISGQNEMISDNNYGLILNDAYRMNDVVDYLSNHHYSPLVTEFSCSNYFADA
uniref:glycosyltransferase n=1 Tax=Flavobacterium sp. TaxID=239 RepID=UPI004049F005